MQDWLHELIAELEQLVQALPEGEVRDSLQRFLHSLKRLAQGEIGPVAQEVRGFLAWSRNRTELPAPLQAKLREFASFWSDYIGEFPGPLSARRGEGDIDIPPPPPPFPDDRGARAILEGFTDRLVGTFQVSMIRGLETAPTTPQQWQQFWQDVQLLRDSEFRGQVPLEVLGRVARRLVALLEQPDILSARERAQAGDMLGCLGDPRPGTGLRLGGARRSPRSRTAARAYGGAREWVPDVLWVEIPGGEFPMGTYADGDISQDDEHPKHVVDLPTFYISRYPITNAQFRRFVEAGGYDKERYWTPEGGAWRTGQLEPGLVVFDDPLLHREWVQWWNSRPLDRRDCPFFIDNAVLGIANRPVIGVTWLEAVAYCRWLTEVLGFGFQEPGQVAYCDRGAISVWTGNEVVNRRLWLTGQDAGVQYPDDLSRYEVGLVQLLNRMGSDHPSYGEALVLQHRLTENITYQRQYGDTEIRRAERAEVIDQLNRLTWSALGATFNELCATPSAALLSTVWKVDLPSEAQWEKAARGEDHREWPWEDGWADGRANTEEAGIHMTSAVGCFPGGASPRGCQDMAGNVWEWTRTKWGMKRYPPDYRYPYRPDDGREDPQGPDLRVVRGGSWINTRAFARCAYRFWRFPERFDSFLGFRVVLFRAFGDQASRPPSRVDLTTEVRKLVQKVTTQPDCILIVTATKTEAQAVLQVFSQVPDKKWTRQVIGNKTYYNLGIHGGAPVSMVQSEMGTATPGGALLTVRQAIQDLHPQAVIMCGIAFGLCPDKQKMGEILVAKQLQYYEPQRVDLQRGQIPRGDRVTSAERLLDRFRSGDNDWRGAPTHFGLVVSGEKLVNDPAFRDWLLKNEPEAIGGEMEGAGLYVAARDAKVDWILVKAICDWADGKKNDDAQQLAARNAAQFVLYVLQLGGWGGPAQLLQKDELEEAIAKLAGLGVAPDVVTLLRRRLDDIPTDERGRVVTQGKAGAAYAKFVEDIRKYL
jgi:formylglycine-generating enzyme required for sulfatase activity/nucleoside phosphorylase